MKSAIDNMIYEYISKTNLLNKVTENASVDWGFKNPTSNTTPYAYDDNGSKTEDHYKGIVTVYNHLTLPVYITNGTDSILMLYDAGGSLLRKQHKSGSTVVMTRDYIGGMEYVNDTLDAIYHSEGKIKYIDEVARYEYYIRDHLGNIRLTYSDLNADGLITTPDEIVEEMHYYPFGMMMTGTWMGSSGQYTYNAIEYETFLDLEINLATYRGLDPTLGRWWQVDPKAEAAMSLTPYNSMGNNPISYVDPEGDIAFVPILVGAAIGAVSAGATTIATNAITGNYIFQGLGKSMLMGAAGGAIGAGISGAFAGTAFGQSTGFGIMNNVASNAATSTAFGQDITLGSLFGSVAGGFVAGQLPQFTGVQGGSLDNAVEEILHKSVYGGITGAVGGGLGAAIDGGNVGDGILNGAKYGAIGGGVQAGLNIIAMGATLYSGPTKRNSAVFRRGGLLTLGIGSGEGMTLGRNLIVKEREGKFFDNTSLRVHEYTHFLQQRKLGYGKFYSRILGEYVQAARDRGHWAYTYHTPGHLEWQSFQFEKFAMQYLFGRF